jgi:hypothetical protein
MTNKPLLSLLRARTRSANRPPDPPVYFDHTGPLPAGIADALDAPGALLNDVLGLIQQRVPGVTGMFIRDGVLFVVHQQAPTPEARAATRAALRDQTELARLAASAAAARAAKPDETR